MFVKPAEGRMVRRPDTFAPLPEGGDEVPRDEFWLRRLRDGDVVEAQPPAPSRPARGDDEPHATEDAA